MNKIYIAGKITNNENYKKQFELAEKALKQEGHLVMNPAVLAEGFPWDAYMPICYSMIDACDGIALLPNWETSKGATLEREYALKTGKRVNYFQGNMLKLVEEETLIKNESEEARLSDLIPS